MTATLEPVVTYVEQASHTTIITLGLEDELQVVDADGALVAHDFERGFEDVPDSSGTSSRELHRCALEVQTPVCVGPDGIIASLAHMRAVAAERARLQGHRVMSAAVHPFSAWTSQEMHDDPVAFPRYAEICQTYGELVSAAMSFGLHVHLGCTSPAVRMLVMNSLRNVLPDVLALSASSPFYEGRDTGLASWRHSLFGRLPRTGVPDVWLTEDDYFDHIDRLRGMGSMQGAEGMWEDVRVHHKFGTIEVRIADSVHSLDRNWLIVALLQAEVATLESEILEGREPAPLERSLIEANKFAVRKDGMRADIIDWATDTVVPMSTRLRAWVKRLAPAASRLGTLQRMNAAVESAIMEGSSADMQRAWFAQGGFQKVIDELVAATAAPLSSYLLPEGN